MVAEPDNLLKAVADPTRRRILQTLVASELSVNDLVAVLQLPQSSVSRHLKTLRDAGLVDARHEGTSATYFPLAGDAGSGAAVNGNGLRSRLMGWVVEQELPGPLQSRLRSVLRSRQSESDAYFARVAHHWDRMRTDFFGPSFHLEALVGLLPADWVVADVGTGTGYLLPILGERFARVHAVDPVAEMLDAARARAAHAKLANVQFHSGTAGEIPLPAGALDLCIASLVLHHEPEPPAALREFARVIKPGGKLLIIEQAAHTHQAFHDLMQDRWWGFEPDALARDVAEAGFESVYPVQVATAEPANQTAPPAPALFALTANRRGQRVASQVEPTRRVTRRAVVDDGWRQY
jgi:ArsR family transcriptional regulator